MEFEWDAVKEASNVAKHGITFMDAATVFADPHHVTEDSAKPEHGEERNIAMAWSPDGSSRSSIPTGRTAGGLSRQGA